MKQILSKLKNKEVDVLFMIIILVSASLLCLQNISDELWNFANSYKMFNGYKIYEELNVIVTPLFFYIAQIFFKIFGANLLAFRLYNVVIWTTFIMLIYLIFKSLKIVRRRAILYTFIMAFIFSSIFVAGANYNILVLIPVLIGLLLIIRKRDNSISLGILLFLTFMIKQNIFVYFSIGIFIYKIINGKNIKQNILELLKIYIISFLGIVLFLLYMHFDNNLYNFINFCFLGISEFGSNNLYINIYSQYLYVSIIAIVFSFFIIYNKKVKENIDNNIIRNTKKILSIGVPLLLMSFPLANAFHITMASTIMLIGLIYLIENILIKHLSIESKKEKIIYIIAIILCTIYIYFVTATCLINDIDDVEIILNDEGPFFGTMTTEKEKANTEEICNYIQEQEKNNVDVKILSDEANLYMVSLNKNNGIFDLAFLGNMGVEGEKGLIERIKKMHNTMIMLKKDEEEMFWQESKLVRDYIINNYEEIGEIQKYSIFYIK